ncbi:hypothetical protein L3Y34_011139 [Caenorhabditis briggsae]|uniref:Uncharacterized protein n=1 Tax=Caenorhabditis briggsae TaxID=6238 RepID=A0AAE8ZN81_CAEBR|nr:hypothetical protein L3Y34_011139 [Caenorhabditis briggsae]
MGMSKPSTSYLLLTMFRPPVIPRPPLHHVDQLKAMQAMGKSGTILYATVNRAWRVSEMTKVGNSEMVLDHPTPWDPVDQSRALH